MCKLYLTELELAKNKVSSLEKQFELYQKEREKNISQEKKVLSVLKGKRTRAKNIYLNTKRALNNQFNNLSVAERKKFVRHYGKI